MAAAKKPKKAGPRKTAAKQPPRRRGRPSTYDAKIAAEICARLSEGETLQSICRDERMPAVRTVNEWTESSRSKTVPESFGADFAQARARGFDAIAAQVLLIADTPVEGVETVVKPDGSVEERRGDMLGHRKLQIETRLKLLAKWDPKRYGERMALEHSGTVTIGERLKRAEQRLAGK